MLILSPWKLRSIARLVRFFLKKDTINIGSIKDAKTFRNPFPYILISRKLLFTALIKAIIPYFTLNKFCNASAKIGKILEILPLTGNN